MTQEIKDYLQRGPATSREIQNHTGQSQSTVAKKLREMGAEIVKLKTGRNIQYASIRNAFGADDILPLTMVDAYGNTVLAAYIRPLAHGGFLVEPATGMPPLLLGASGNGLYDDLPYFLFDMSPQGYLGRQIARQLASISSDFPSDPKYWNTDHIGRYLISNGDDLPGNFKLGQQAFLRVRRKPIAVKDEDYPQLADSVISGDLPGSSAGGEQPKFTAYSDSRSAHVIVKFSPKGDNEISRRWRDILITEYHAIETLHSKNYPAAETRLLGIDDRLFLESQRFDRAGEFGRLSTLSLQSIDSEYTGIGGNWPNVIDALLKKKLVSWQHAFDVGVYWCFGRLISNTDMHLGNLSFAIEGGAFRLLPVYDMCSMGFAPRSGGEVTPFSFIPPKIKDTISFDDNTLDSIKMMAHDFWERVANDQKISSEFKTFLDQGNPIDLME